MAGRRAVPHLAISLGDPRGIGAEVTHKALAQLEQRSDFTYTLFGSAEPVPSPAEAGAIAGRAIEQAVARALAGQADAVVTAPIDKTAFAAAGYPYPGHTEMLAALAGNRPVVMMMSAERTRLGGALRVVLATIHVPLAQVPRLLTEDLLVEQTRITAQALEADWGIAQPKVALCAFNPHASDGGLFGDEEARIMTPARDRLRADGLQVSGPFPADTVFVRALSGEFDAVIAPYHDVGMAAFKTASFGKGVNVTLGLPFPRTSPDHGTALDIAGKGVADSSSMQEAIELAIRLAAKRNSAAHQ